nr:unnamed protein product [Callosobruchus chinensis]
MEWSQQIVLVLLEEYQKREILWKPRHPLYYNTIKKEDAWREIAAILNVEVQELKKKMESLKGSFRREKSRVKKGTGTGKGNPLGEGADFKDSEEAVFLDQRLWRSSKCFRLELFVKCSANHCDDSVRFQSFHASFFQELAGGRRYFCNALYKSCGNLKEENDIIYHQKFIEF